MTIGCCARAWSDSVHRKDQDMDSRLIACPYCRESIEAQASKCKHCGSALASSQPMHRGTCPYCKESIKPDAVKCRHCKSDLLPPTAVAPVSHYPSLAQG